MCAHILSLAKRLCKVLIRAWSANLLLPGNGGGISGGGLSVGQSCAMMHLELALEEHRRSTLRPHPLSGEGELNLSCNRDPTVEGIATKFSGI